MYLRAFVCREPSCSASSSSSVSTISDLDGCLRRGCSSRVVRCFTSSSGSSRLRAENERSGESAKWDEVRKETVRSKSKLRVRTECATTNDDEPRREREREREERPPPRPTYCVSRIGRTRIPIETRGARGYMCDVSTSVCSSVFRRAARSEADGERCRVSMCVPGARVCARGRPFAGAPRYRTRCRARPTGRRHSPQPFPRRVHPPFTATGRERPLIATAILRAPQRTKAAESGDERAKRKEGIFRLYANDRACVCAMALRMCARSYMCTRGRRGDLPDILG